MRGSSLKRSLILASPTSELFSCIFYLTSQFSGKELRARSSLRTAYSLERQFVKCHYSSECAKRQIPAVSLLKPSKAMEMPCCTGETIEKPHHYECQCMECKIRYKDDLIKLAKARLTTYKALASEAYISLTSPDPILTAFDLSQEIQAIARVEKYYKVYEVGLHGWT